MEQSKDLALCHMVVEQMRACGHFLYYRMGGRVGRRRILVLLSRYDEMRQKDLQDLLQIQSGSLSEMIIGLEAAGYVEKGRSAADGRQLTLRLTPAGRKRAAQFKAEYEARVAEMMSCLTTEQTLELRSMLDTLLNHWAQMEFSKKSEE